MSFLAGFANINKVPELRRRVLFTFAMLAVYRIGAFVTIPGVDRNVMRAVMNKQGGGLLGFFNMFSGGALSNLSIFAIGIMPYVSASIVLQLLTMVFKPLDGGATMVQIAETGWPQTAEGQKQSYDNAGGWMSYLTYGFYKGTGVRTDVNQWWTLSGYAQAGFAVRRRSQQHPLLVASVLLAPYCRAARAPDFKPFGRCRAGTS